MFLYKKKKRYSSETGEEVDPFYIKTNKAICDFSGKEIDSEYNEYTPQYSIRIEYENSCEEVYYYDDDRKYFEDLGINYHSLFKLEYHFWVGEDYQDMSCNLLNEWNKGFNDDKSIFYHCLTLENALRLARIRTVKRLLEEKKYSKEELGLEENY